MKEEIMKTLQECCHLYERPLSILRTFKELPNFKKVHFKQIRVDDDPKTYLELKERTNLQLRQVFVDGEFTGSATDFFSWIDG